MSTFTKLQNIVAVRNFLAVSQSSCRRTFHISSVNHLKEVRTEEKDGSINIKGVYVKSPREGHLLRMPHKPLPTECTECPICRLGPTIHVRHTDVLLLHQFVDSRGKILPKRVTGLCSEQYRRMNYLIIMSRHAGLLPKRLPDGSISLVESEDWRANNKYYDESAIDDFFTTNRRKV